MNIPDLSNFSPRQVNPPDVFIDFDDVINIEDLINYFKGQEIVLRRRFRQTVCLSVLIILLTIVGLTHQYFYSTRADKTNTLIETQLLLLQRNDRLLSCLHDLEHQVNILESSKKDSLKAISSLGK